MPKDSKGYFRIPGVETKFHSRAIRELIDFFDIKNRAELKQACVRFEEILLCRDFLPPQGLENIGVILFLADELYEDFRDLDKPLRYRLKAKQNGPRRKKRDIPLNILELMKDVQSSDKFPKKPSLIEAIKYLQKIGKLTCDLAPGTLKKEIELKRRQEDDLNNLAAHFEAEMRKEKLVND